MRKDIIKLLVLISILNQLNCLDNGLGLTPPMGWNSWNKFGCNINEKIIIDTIDALNSSGLVELGYNYINLDDCWQKERDEKGKIVPDLVAFPKGIKYLADYAHSKGLKFGLLSDAGAYTCSSRPGSLNYEESDAKTYAEWGVDYLKYTNCQNEDSKSAFIKMRDALNHTGRPIFYSLCNWGQDGVSKWGKDVGNSWRIGGGITDNWNSMINLIDENDKWYKYAGRGGWNDPDMLEVGNGGMNKEEYKIHFGLWAIAKAPLLIGCDITNMNNETKSILANPEVIAINQDSLGEQGHKIKSDGTKEVWTGKLSDDSYAVLLLNRGYSTNELEIKWTEIGFNEEEAKVRDLWERKDLGNLKEGYKKQLDKHTSQLLKITPIKQGQEQGQEQGQQQGQNQKEEEEPEEDKKPEQEELKYGCLGIIIIIILLILLCGLIFILKHNN